MMEETDKQRINSHIKILVERTVFASLMRSIERLDKSGVIPARLMSRWREMGRLGYTNEQQNMTLYAAIQERGPEAYQLLVDSLYTCGHTDLACILDPTLSLPEEHSAPVPEESYSDEGTHFVHFDENWIDDKCCSDRNALKNLFEHLGYQEIKDVKGCKESNGSLIIIIFCKYHDDVSPRETEWVYDGLLNDSLNGKPKIIISLRYFEQGQRQGATQEDSGPIYKLFRDYLNLKIYVNRSTKTFSERSQVSEEVHHLIRVFKEENPPHLLDKIRKLSGVFKDNCLHPVVLHDSGFNKLYHLKKTPVPEEVDGNLDD